MVGYSLFRACLESCPVFVSTDTEWSCDAAACYCCMKVLSVLRVKGQETSHLLGSPSREGRESRADGGDQGVVVMSDSDVRAVTRELSPYGADRPLVPGF